MKTYDNLYEKMCSLDNLLNAYKKARKGKSKQWYVKKFEENLDSEILKLKLELEMRTYHPKKLKRFIIRDPKTRVIHASHFRDRVVHHAVCNLLEPIFDRIFIYDSYASRKNKGALAAVERFDEFQKKVSKNGRLLKKPKDDNMIVGYVLKCDIKKYFDTVNHYILVGIIKNKIKDENIIWLIRTILEYNEKSLNGGGELGQGMPKGNYTSQFFANVYLNELDYFVKHNLKAKYYIRYVDDFVILDVNEKMLREYKEKIEEFLKRLKIDLHPNKSNIYPLHKGIDFLGFRMFYFHRLPSRKNIRKIRKKLEYLHKLCKRDDISPDKITEAIDGWYSYAMWGSTYKLRKKISNLIK